MDSLIKVPSETIKNKGNYKKVEFLPILLDVLAANLLVGVSVGREVLRASKGSD